MKKIMLVIPVFLLGILVSAQHFETTLKIVGGKARIVIKAVGGTITGAPSGATFCVAIPAANSGATIVSPSSPAAGPVSSAGAGILDAARLPVTIQTANFTDATYKYFIFLMTNGNASQTFTVNTEYELIELTFGGSTPAPVSLISMPNGSIAGGPPLDGQWINYLENGGTQYSFGNQLFYASANTLVPRNNQSADYSTDTSTVTTNVLVSLPVHLLNFSGYKNGSKNKLLWTTASEENSRGFEVQRSLDGVNYFPVGYVNTLAPGGNSATSINYTFADNNPVGKKQYYRLSQQDFDGNGKLSNIVVIKGDRAAALGIGGLFPNPASTQVNVIIDAPAKDKISMQVTDMAGKLVHQQLVYVDIGSNTIPVDIAKLASGSYLVKLTCQASDCATAVGKFNKQ